MKKIIILFMAIMLFNSCTIRSEDIQMLQKRYDVVYHINDARYICTDSLHVYHVRITLNGKVESIVKIK